MDFTMNIGLNGQNLLNPFPAGPEKYTFNLYKSLSKIDNKNKYTLYLNNNPGESISELFRNTTFTFKVIRNRLFWTQFSLAKILYFSNINVFFTPVHTIPIVRNKKIKYLSMIHGLEYSSYKPKNIIELLSKGKPEKYTCINSDHIITPSNSTKDKIISKGWASSDKITVISEGVDESFYKRDYSEIDKVKNKYNLSNKQYIIFVGTIQPRKNLENTIKAFSLALKDLNRNDLVLFIAGKKGWDYENILKSPQIYNIEDKVIFGGRIPDENLPALISGSIGMVNFSIDEGFGLPVLEAMSCEVPCALSNIPSFKEIIGNYALYSDNNPDQMKETIIKLITDDHTNMIKMAKDKAREYSWDETARKTLGIFNLIQSSN